MVRDRLPAHEHLGQRLGEGPAPGVEEPLAEDGLHVDVDDHRLLVELRRPGHHLPVVVEDQRRPVEDELVLAADQVDVDQPAGRVGGPGGQHPLPLDQAPGVVRRGVQVDDELGTAGRLVGDRPVGRPGVLADDDTHPHPADDEELAFVGAGHEVPLLVEDAVVGEEALAVDAPHRPLAAHRGRVEQVAARVHEADDGRAPPRAGGQLLQGGLVVGDEAGLEEQVLGRVAGDGQLREHGQVTALGLGRVEGGEDPAQVPVEVAHDQVQLAGGDPNARHVTGYKEALSRPCQTAGPW